MKRIAVLFFHLALASMASAQTDVRASNAPAPAQKVEVKAAPAAAPEAKSLLVYGNTLHYTEAGSGPVVVLLHGLGASKEMWSGNVAALASNHRVIALDQLGFGKSDKPLIEYRVGTLVDFLDGFLRILNIERATLIGSSLGGWVALRYTLDHPERVERLVLVDASGFRADKKMDPAFREMLTTPTRAAVRRVLRAMFVNPLFSSDAAVERVFSTRMSSGDGYTVTQMIESLERTDESIDGSLGAITQPVLIVWGEGDQLVPLSWGERFKKEIKNSKLVVIPAAGHVPMVEKRSDFDRIVGEWLATP
jgi:pimeloyl-ACP methyl ester carboxylesterase